MKRLILMRHAKSSWSDPEQRDIDRPLNKRGRRDAPDMGRWLNERNYLPEKALVSTAARTRETWSGLLEGLPACPVEFQDRLFHATAATMLGALRAVVGCDRVLMLGHQPGIGDFAARLVADAPNDAEFEKFPTAAVAIFDFQTDDWQDLDWRSGVLTDFVVPRMLGKEAS